MELALGSDSLPNFAAAAAILLLPLAAWRVSRKPYPTFVVALLALSWAGFFTFAGLRGTGLESVGNAGRPVFALLVPLVGLYVAVALFRPSPRDGVHLGLAGALLAAAATAVALYANDASLFGPPAAGTEVGPLALFAAAGPFLFAVVALALARSIPEPPSPWSEWALAHAATGFFLAPAFVAASAAVNLLVGSDDPKPGIVSEGLTAAALLPLILAFAQVLRVRTVSVGTSLRRTLNSFLALMALSAATGLLASLVFIAAPPEGARLDHIFWAVWTALGVFFMGFSLFGSARASLPALERFQAVRQLGTGSYGKAILARDRALDREVVLKQPTGEWLADAEQRTMFLREARLLARVHHPNVVTVHEILADEKPPLLVLEYMEGGSVRDALEKGVRLPPADAARIASDLLEGLAAIHDVGVVHRDLKPANILLTKGGLAKVSDFGVARSEREAQQGLTLAATGYQPGTAVYMSPEQARGDRVDARSDLYAAGAILHQMLTGRHYLPFEGKSDFDVRRLIQEAKPAWHASVPAALRPFLERALAKPPGQRFPDARAMHQALTAALEPSPKGTPAGPGAGRVPKAPRA
ncbi:MAG: serine/threonine protein kinase [Euryarchaeota archaeon]|nr:serine/threonine protein kinase [Euryarchaeota archaeon]